MVGGAGGERADPQRAVDRSDAGGRAVQSFYRRHARIYDLTRWLFLHRRGRAIKRLQLKPDSSVLEIGCGTGLNLSRLARAVRPPKGTVLGVDFSEAMLARARQRIRSACWNHVQVHHTDATQLNLDGAFDAVLFSYSLAMIPDWPEATVRAWRHLKPGGRLAVLDFGRFERWGPLGTLCRVYLRSCHVSPGLDVMPLLQKLDAAILKETWLGGYGFLIVATKPL